jgi:hypothetical protein
MKKRLLFLGIAAGLISYNANAQLALETFNAAGMPAGWVMINDGHTVSSSFTTVPGIPAALTANAWTKVHSVSAAGDSQMITTSLFTPSGTADRWLITPSFLVTSPNTVIQWQDYNLASTGEMLDVLVSPSAGTTAGSFTATVSSAAAASGGLTTHQAAIGAYNGTTIRIAFHYSMTNLWGIVVDNVQSSVLPTLDMGVTTVYLAPFLQTGSSNTITGVIKNYGYNTVTSMNLNYSVNGGTPVSTPLTGLSIPLGTTYNFTSGTPWAPSTGGSYLIKVWADNINGGTDGNHTNDTLSGTVVVVDSLQPKRVMIEEFTQASCDPCAAAHINVDTVYGNNLSRAVMLRYHVNFPGRDMMNEVTQTPFVGTRLSYYGVSGVPDAQVDGKYVYPGATSGGLSTAVISAAASAGSPFKITVTPSYDTGTKTYSFSAAIKCYGPMAAGLKAYACLIVDTLTYALNQSTESIPQTVFPQVAENMFPSASGTTLTAFTTGSTQTITGNWVKNHPWGNSFSTWNYDSTKTGKIIVWVENDAQKYVYQAAYGNVPTAGGGHGVGVNAVTGNNGSIDVYPNPASQVANVSLNLNTAATVKMEVYNILGKMVSSIPAEHRNSGASSSAIDLSNLASGEYFVKVTIDGETLTKTLSVTK